MPPTAKASDPVLDGLHKVCDERARAATEADAVAGVLPRYVAAPTSTEQAAEVMSLAAQHELRVVARGAGTKLDWGLPPTAVDLVVDMTGLSGVVEHVAGDLVCVVRAGTPVRDLQQQLSGHGQQLALDCPLDDATVGGTVAVSTSGPRRLLYGTLRDLLIGVTFVRADGVVAKAGGKVVKNVAGYDFGKLLTGSYGTLGLVTEAVVRLHPVPAVRRVVTLTTDQRAEAGRLAASVVGSQLVPSAVELDQAGDGPVTVTALFEGIEEGVEGRARSAVDLLGSAASVGEELPAGFARYPFAPGGTGLKLTSTITGVAELLHAAHELTADGTALTVRGSAAGVLYAGLPARSAPDEVRMVLDRLRSVSSAWGGNVTVLVAPPEVRHAVDVWGPVPGLDLMRRVKDEMDPGHRLAPGRFVGGI